MTKTLLYARVSTNDQNLEHQLSQAEAAGFVIDEVVADHGVSGVSTKLSQRAEGKRLYDKLRDGDILVVRWVDRLGRNYQDVTEAIRHFMKQGVVIRTVINNLTFNGATKDPMQQAVRDALIAFMAATAEAQAEAIKEAQKAGIEAAKADGSKYRGKKPSFTRQQYNVVCQMSAKGEGPTAIVNATDPVMNSEMNGKNASKLTRQTVIRIRNDPKGAAQALERWGL
ncbi:recombinase family protein [Cognatishimia activa]|uniref:Recombinase family protein n=1 Tax=Cognatishimia activa TaxID=1715691 RepID=A0A975ES34_9RHOB|nr:recombinase family protein [Cognatishimia activa]QTN36802.1 recombinase family protein [Cognatishimia activa]